MRDDAVLGRALPLDRGLGPIVEEDDEMFMTRSLNVTPKTTEQRI